jgi:hypothetical protein
MSLNKYLEIQYLEVKRERYGLVFIYIHKRIKTLTLLIFMKLAILYQHHAVILC